MKPDSKYRIGFDPFGQLVPNRHRSSNAYRYGFQGQEMDNEIKGEGNSLNYTFRMHDPRVGRFFAVDPLAEQGPEYSPYCYAMNNPINMVDPDGRWPFPSWSQIKSRATSMVRDVAYAVVAKTVSTARNYVAQKSKEILNAITPSNPFTKAKPEKAGKGSGYGVSFTTEGGKDGGMKTPQGGRDVKQVDMSVIIGLTDIYGPETTIPGVAPDGSNPFAQSNTSSASPTTAGTPSTSDNGMITMPLEDYSATPVVQWNESQLHKQTKDTSVTPSQKPVIDGMNRKSRLRATEAVNSNNRELQKKIDYYKE